MTGAKFDELELIRWIVEKSPKSSHNLSLSGLSEPNFNEMGVETLPRDQFEVNRRAEEMFLGALEEVYGLPRSNVILTTGGSEAIFLLSLLAWKRNQKIGVRNPEYQPLFKVPANLGLQVRPSHSLDGLKEMAGKGYSIFLSNPNNPVGTLLKKDDIEDMVSQSSGKSFVYVDEAFLEFKFQKNPDSVFFQDDHLIINGSMTKFYGFSNYRVGWIAGSRENIEEIGRIRTTTGISNPKYPLWIAAQALLNRSRFQERALKIIPANRQALREFIESSDIFSWDYPSASSYALINYDLQQGSVDLCSDILDKTGVLLSPGVY
ncbi:MAG: aminotransferase class I/II-fold pyridoxal phosphate-dependent enzyme, partial [Thermoplasmataceae archaeon]